MDFTGYTDEAVRLAVDLVNTYDPVPKTEGLSEPDDLLRLLKDHELSYRGKITRRDLHAVRELRDQLRGVFEAATESEAAAIINSLLAGSNAMPQLTDHDGLAWHVHFTSPANPLADRLGAETAMGLAVVVTNGGFDRMRICRAERCMDVFVDMSKNRSRRFCSPEVCGNRASVAAYRQRQKKRTLSGQDR